MLPIQIQEKPMECISAIALIAVGITLGLLNIPWLVAVGTATAALGGALLSYATTTVNLRSKAASHLGPELQAMARHLADTAAKLNRTIQSFYQGEIEAEVTIDRVGLLISSIYSSLNDVHELAGSTTNFQTLVDTVRACEDMAARLEELTSHAGAPNPEVEQLREQLESARLQLDTARKAFGDVSQTRREEKVNCPICNDTVAVHLGTLHGESAVGSCSNCGTARFHVHRGQDGIPFTRLWGNLGAASRRKALEVSCANCRTNVPLNFDLSKEFEHRFCMNCCTDLKIASSGQIVEWKESHPIGASHAGYAGARQLLGCPDCSGTYVAIWANEEVVRSVCPRCSVLLEAVKKNRFDQLEVRLDGN